MQESVVYQRIVAESIQKGLQRGLEQGLQKGESVLILGQLIKMLWPLTRGRESANRGFEDRVVGDAGGGSVGFCVVVGRGGGMVN